MNGFSLKRLAILAGLTLLVQTCVSVVSAVAAIEVRELRTGVTPERTRLVLDLASEGATWRVAEQTERGAVVLFAGVRLGDSATTNLESVGRITTAKLEAEGDAGLRLAIQMSAASDIKIFTLSNPPRWVLDVLPASAKGSAGGEPVKAAEPAPDEPSSKSEESRPGVADGATGPAESTKSVEEVAPQAPSPSETVPEAVADAAAGAKTEIAATVEADATPSEPAPRELLPEPERRGPRVVVIDAGHGGEDPGATGPGLREKDVCLDVARRLHRALSAMEGVHPVLTRSRDVIVPLRQRMKLAEEVEADLFVSIHVNAAEATDAHGVEVFFLSLRGASDEASRELAKAENAALAVSSPEASDAPQELPFNLSLRQSDTLIRSSLAAEAVLNSFVERDLAENRGVRQAAFVVLKSVQVPSILVELGFASNAVDREKLKKEEHRQQLADALGQGVKAYFDRFAPERSAN
ncbi:MAG: N-acetylmuramoyl-L-alanine amidase [Candidatus Eisenbacteria bacterium]|nr:N-acetylmuramoyl-L-alanine amidase [Candidatus Eisenbacteria bacterium]